MKQITEIDESTIFDDVLKATPFEDKLFVAKSLEIASQIVSIMEMKGLLQKDLAVKLGKTEPEISKWLCGFHNFTLKTITKIESVLEHSIIITPKEVKQQIDDHFKRVFKSFTSQKIEKRPMLVKESTKPPVIVSIPVTHKLPNTRSNKRTYQYASYQTNVCN